MKNFYKKLIVFTMIALTLTSVVSISYAKINNLSESENNILVEEKGDFDYQYSINLFEEMDDGKYVAKAFNQKGLFGYIIVTETSYECVYLDDMPVTEISEYGKEYDPEEAYDIMVGHFKVDSFFANQLKNLCSSKTVNQIPVVIKGKDYIMAILNDGTYAVVENSAAVVTHIVNPETFRYI